MDKKDGMSTQVEDLDKSHEESTKETKEPSYDSLKLSKSSKENKV